MQNAQSNAPGTPARAAALVPVAVAVVLAGATVAWGTPPTPVVDAAKVPDGARCDVAAGSRQREAKEGGRREDVPGKAPPSAEAADTAACRRAPLSRGTVESRPMRGGSCEGCVRLP